MLVVFPLINKIFYHYFILRYMQCQTFYLSRLFVLNLVALSCCLLPRINIIFFERFFKSVVTTPLGRIRANGA